MTDKRRIEAEKGLEVRLPMFEIGVLAQFSIVDHSTCHFRDPGGKARVPGSVQDPVEVVSIMGPIAIVPGRIPFGCNLTGVEQEKEQER